MANARTLLRLLALTSLGWLGTAAAQAATPLELLQQLDGYPHARDIAHSQQEVLDYEVGLGAIQKISGTWQFKHSERVNGELAAYTWQIIDGFTSIEVMQELRGRVETLDGAKLLFECSGRACGRGVQWANRVFHQPLLYGREDMQRYRVYSVGESPRRLLMIYAAARTSDRQYLHAQVLEVTP